MKKTLFAVLLALPLTAIGAEHNPADVCHSTISYTIVDRAGIERDKTVYFRGWDMTCTDAVKLKYAMLDALLGGGNEKYKAMTAQD